MMNKRNKFRALIILLGMVAAQPLGASDDWVASAEIKPDTPYFGITSANGTIGMVSSREPFQCENVILADVYDVFGRGRVSNFLPQVNPVHLEITLDGSRITASKVKDYVQQMDLSDGSFTGKMDFRGHQVSYTYRALRQLPNAVMMEVQITASGKCALRIDNIHSLPASLHDASMTARTLTFHHKPGTRIDLLTTSSLSPTGKVRCVTSSAILTDTVPVHLQPDMDKHLYRIERTMEAGETLSFRVVGALISTAQVSDPLNQAERIVTYTALQDPDELVRRHKEAWRQLWKGDIRIGGDETIQREVRTMLYHLYAFNRTSGSFSPSPMGLSGLGYNGHVFWDTEIFMTPTLQVLNPMMARSNIQYRFDRLSEARRNAASWGYLGAMFPWESAESGAEECPVTSLSGTFQHHVTADVAIAAWNYFRATQDRDWLRETGWPILRETAKFWASRVEEQDGKYHIRNVMAADEWALNVDDDAYTNGAALRNLEYAAAAAKVLGIPAPAEWNTIAGALVQESFEGGVTREHATYDGAKIKQGDVVLLYWPLGLTDGPQALRDLAYYQQKVPKKGTPAMTKCINSIICSREGRTEEALRWFTDSYRPNLRPPFGVIAEFEGGTNPYFLTGAGGALQAIIFGFGGYDLTDEGLVCREQKLPRSWTSLEIIRNRQEN